MDEKQAGIQDDPTSRNELKGTSSPQAEDDKAVENTVIKDGFKVHPQPTADPLDPLNWSKTKKHGVLGVVMLKYFLFTYITTTTVPSFLELQEIYGISYAQVNWTVAIPALGLATGPLLWSSFADIYGRRTVFLIGSIMSIASTIGAVLAPNYGGYMAARFFQGLGVSPAATVGLAAINDMFFEHERGQKVGLWVLAIDTGLLVGPIFGGFLNIVSAAWIQWFTLILFGVLFVLELLLMPESLYPRSHMVTAFPLMAANSNDTEKQNGRGSIDLHNVSHRVSDASVSNLPRTLKLPFINYKPVPGMRHPKPWDSLLRFIISFKFLPISIAVFTYCFCWYWWVLSVITMLPAAYPTYAPQIQGLLFIGLLLGTLVSEIFLGGTLSDKLVLTLAKRNNGIKLPEARLWLAYPAGILSAIGLIVWGISIDKNYHWIIGQIAFFLFAAGIQVGNTVICAYIVDSYPLQSMSVVTFYAVLLNLSAFIDPFFIAPFQATAGWTWCFAAQGIIIVFGALPVLAVLHFFGPKLRLWCGTPSWVNPEFDT